MVSTTTFIAFVSCVIITFSTLVECFYPFYPLISLAAVGTVQQAAKICPTNNTNEEQFKVILDDAYDCYTNFSQKSQSLCNSFQSKIKRCSQPMVDFFVDCFPEKSKDLPPAAVITVTSLVNTFCVSSGELLVEVFNPCFHEFIDQKEPPIKKQCKKEVFEQHLNRFKEELPSKSEACRVFREIGDCWKESVDRDCESSKSKEFFFKFSEAVLAACN